MMSRTNGWNEGRRWVLIAGRALLLICGMLVPRLGRADAPPATTTATLEIGENGQLSHKFRIDDANPEASVPDEATKNRNPLEFGYFLQDLLLRAEEARKAKDQSGVIRYYRAVAKAVPDRAKGWSKLCEAYDQAHDRERAIHACKYALERDGVELGDYVRYVGLVVSKPDDLTADERKDLTGVLDHLAKEPDASLAFRQLQCQAGVKIKNATMLEECTAALDKIAPDDAKTVIFKWSLAMLKGRTDEAGRLVERAREMGVLSDAVARMQNLTAPGGRRAWLLWAAGGATIGLGLALALLWMARLRLARKSARFARAA